MLLDTPTQGHPAEELKYGYYICTLSFSFHWGCHFTQWNSQSPKWPQTTLKCDVTKSIDKLSPKMPNIVIFVQSLEFNIYHAETFKILKSLPSSHIIKTGFK